MIPLHRAVSFTALVLLAGCAQGIVPTASAPAPPQEQAPAPGTDAGAPPPTAVTVEDFDTTSAEERAEAAKSDTSEAGETLGTTIASLGDATQPGFWAETPLVSSIRPGMLAYPATGKTVRVELRPSGAEVGSGTRVSLSALRVLDAPLVGLPELTVTGF